MELLTGEESVLDALGVLVAEVIQLGKVVDQHGALIISGLVDVLKGSMEEVGSRTRNQSRVISIIMRTHHYNA